MCCMWLAENTWRKIRHLRAIAQLYRAISYNEGLYRQSEKLLNSNMCPTRPHYMANFGPLTAEIGLGVWGPQQISTGFASWLRYCNDVAQRIPTKLCTMFRRLLDWYNRPIYTQSFAKFVSAPGCHDAARHCLGQVVRQQTAHVT